ncbi:MAG TPA: hypothetical protein VH165_34035 [Kofleriaceae bacterium]|nr:hypothetical protein [Kofleriaceae bacterium]
MEGERFSVTGHLGSYLREASVLILVFGLLDPLVGSAHTNLNDRLSEMTGDWALFVLAVSLLLFGIGLFLDWLRKPSGSAS